MGETGLGGCFLITQVLRQPGWMMVGVVHKEIWGDRYLEEWIKRRDRGFIQRSRRVRKRSRFAEVNSIFNSEWTFFIEIFSGQFNFFNGEIWVRNVDLAVHKYNLSGNFDNCWAAVSLRLYCLNKYLNVHIHCCQLNRLMCSHSQPSWSYFLNFKECRKWNFYFKKIGVMLLFFLIVTGSILMDDIQSLNHIFYNSPN